MAPRVAVKRPVGEAVKCTPAQKKMLLELLCQRPKLSSGKLEKDFTSADRRKGWEEVADIINAEGAGPAKTYDKWNKCWNDYKSSVKAKVASVNKSRRITGGGSETNIHLLPEEEKLAAVFLPSTACVGDSSVAEAGIELEPPEELQAGQEIYVNEEGQFELGAQVETSAPLEDIIVQSLGVLEDTENIESMQTPSANAQDKPVWKGSNPSAPNKKKTRTQVTVSTLEETVKAAQRLCDIQTTFGAALTSMATSFERIAQANENMVYDNLSRTEIFLKLSQNVEQFINNHHVFEK